jgi:collagen type III alpha
MARFLLPPLFLGGLLLLVPAPATRAADGDTPKDVPPAIAELLKASPEEIIKRFDKDNDGLLTPEEAPPALKRFFERADTNGDGKLDKEEIANVQRALRQRFGQAPPAGGANKEQIDRGVTMLLERFDKNKDGKISKDEAPPRLAENFDRFDTNKDGFLDKDELRRVAAQFAGGQPGGAAGERGNRPEVPAGAVPDFDALDRDADGRLTPDELKGTPYAEKFDQIDANKDGKIDRKEWAAYFQKKDR